MITISAFKDREEALISKALLEAAGVPVLLKDEVGQLQLQVRDTDAQLAQDVLVTVEPRGWRRRGPRSYSRHYHSSRGGASRVGRQFFKGGGAVVVAFLLLLLVLIPLGVEVRVTPFVLLFVFVFGGCGALVRRFFRIRPKRRLRRQLS